MIIDYVDTYRDRFGVEPICAVLYGHGARIAPSTYYARLNAPVTAAELEEAYLVNAMVTLHAENWGSTGCASCGTRAVVPIWRSVGTRSPA